MIEQPPPSWFHGTFGMKEIHLFAGFAGGLVRGLVAHNFSWPQRITSAVVGGLTAGYGTPAVVPIVRRWLEIWSYPSGDMEGSIGFALGLVGMTICDAIIRWARRWRDGGPGLPLPPKSSG